MSVVGKKKGRRAGKELTCTARAMAKGVRISPRKARLVVEMVRGQQVEPALEILAHCPQRGARIVEKLLQSAIANARERAEADVDRLWVTGGWVDMGKTMRRWLPRAHGRATPLRKRASHITLLVGER